MVITTSCIPALLLLAAAVVVPIGLFAFHFSLVHLELLRGPEHESA